MSKPQDFAQLRKVGRGWLIVRNSATLADTDYEHVGKEIVTAINSHRGLLEALQYARRMMKSDSDTAFVDAAISKALGG